MGGYLYNHNAVNRYAYGIMTPACRATFALVGFHPSSIIPFRDTNLEIRIYVLEQENAEQSKYIEKLEKDLTEARCKYDKFAEEWNTLREDAAVSAERTGTILGLVNNVWGNTYSTLCKNVKLCADILGTKRRPFHRDIINGTKLSTIEYFGHLQCYGCGETKGLQIEHLNGRYFNTWKDSAMACEECNRNSDTDKELKDRMKAAAEDVKKRWAINHPEPQQGKLPL